MKITNVEAIHLRVAIPREGQHFTDLGQIASIETVLVKIAGEDGLVGWGECKVDPPSCAAVTTQINAEFARRLVGEDARDTTRLWELLYAGDRLHYAIEQGYSFPQTIARGVPIAAIAGIDMALHDLKGKALGVPVYQLLGGKVRDRVPLYASGGWAKADKIGEQLQGYLAFGGFKAVKMRVGTGDGSFAKSVERVHAARRALGEDIGIAVDSHGTFPVAEAKRFCRQVQDDNLLWFEDPVSPDNRIGFAQVRASTDIPIATGERASTRFDVRALLDLEAMDVVQPDLSVCGGITEGMRIAALAQTYNVRVAPHSWGGAVLFHASLHFAAASPAVFILEYSMSTNPLLRELPEEPPLPKDGTLAPPDRPGLGVTPRADFIAAHRVDR